MSFKSFTQSMFIAVCTFILIWLGLEGLVAISAFMGPLGFVLTLLFICALLMFNEARHAYNNFENPGYWLWAGASTLLIILILI